jgi:hypothetical protein
MSTLTSDFEVSSLVKQSEDDVIRTRVGRHGWKYSDAIYHRRWMARVMRKIIVDANGCWRWQGFKGQTGYAQTGYRGAAMNGHRAMYMIHFGVKLATEQYVLHRCDVRDCINPDHLWIGTAKENNNDCAKKGRHYEGSKTHCHRNHEFTPENTSYKRGKTGKLARTCKTCNLIKTRLDNGWTLEEALSLPKIPHGYRKESAL